MESGRPPEERGSLPEVIHHRQVECLTYISTGVQDFTAILPQFFLYQASFCNSYI